ncbi:MAG: hypothetical protein LBO67_00405 [Spirochaetaceae bacterium]|jgi:hypothetical protein|nr:hypothetical protein [Spirochaetaceae bacterium]
MAEEIVDRGVWYAVLGAALQIPGAKVERRDFLAKEYGKYCNPRTVERIVREGALQAGVDVRLMDKLAQEAIAFHTGVATSLSFVAGIPGGLTMLATVPADIAQYYYHVIVIAQKLAYLYGFADMGIEENNFKSLITMLIGVMAGIEGADKAVVALFSAQVRKDVTALVLEKGFSKMVMRIALALSYRLTGNTVFKSFWKAVPLVGGIVSGAITLGTFHPMCLKLQERLHYSTQTVSTALSTMVIR